MSKTFKDTPSAKDNQTNIISEYNDYDELIDIELHNSYTFRNITVVNVPPRVQIPVRFA